MTKSETRRLIELSEEIAKIAAASAMVEGGGGGAVLLTAARVRGMIRARRLRDSRFEAGTFSDPTWDMMLDLLASRLEGRRAQVSSVCAAAAVPVSTALRRVRLLAEKGLLVRTTDPRDGRRVFIELSEQSYLALVECLTNVRAAGENPM